LKRYLCLQKSAGIVHLICDILIYTSKNTHVKLLFARLLRKGHYLAMKMPGNVLKNISWRNIIAKKSRVMETSPGHFWFNGFIDLFFCFIQGC